MINSNTPIERYIVKGRSVYVKREDLSTNYPAPSLAKLRGVYSHLQKKKADGINLIGVLDTRISKSAWGVTAISRNLNLRVRAYYPSLKAYTEPPFNQQKAQELGAELVPLKGGRTAVLYAKAKKDIEALGGYMMPMGLVVKETVEEVAKESLTIPEGLLGGDVVVCSGSGMITAGLFKGLGTRCRIVAISCGMSIIKQAKRIEEVLGYKPINIMLIQGNFSYYEEAKIEVPFPTSVYYDAKAWKWLVDNIEVLRSPIIFWNIGV